MHLTAAISNSEREYHHFYIAIFKFYPQSKITQDAEDFESQMNWALYSINAQTALTTILWHPAFRSQPEKEQTRAKTTTQHPWDVNDLVAALYVGTYLDIPTTTTTTTTTRTITPVAILGACADISTLFFEASHARASHTSPTSATGAVMSVLDVMHELGVLTLPTSARAVAEFAAHVAAKYDRYGQTPKVMHGLDWMGEGLLDLSWVQACVDQEWMGRAFMDLSFLPDVQKWVEDEDNVLYLADHGCLPPIA